MTKSLRMIQMIFEKCWGRKEDPPENCIIIIFWGEESLLFPFIISYKINTFVQKQ